MSGPLDPNRGEAVKVVADTLRIDAATAEVVRAFDAAGIPNVVLKGPSLARWLYEPDEPRGYNDSDVLIRARDQTNASSVLSELGFAPQSDQSGLPDWWREHAYEWWREADGVLVDLHDALPGVAVDPDTAWDALTAKTDELVVARQPVRVLTIPGRALHVALHAAHHGKLGGKVRDDLARALARADESVWREAADLAARLDAMDAFAVGMRMLPAGAALAERLQLPANRSVAAALKADVRVPLALAFEQVASARGMRARLGILARKLFPPPGFMRRWYPRAATSRRALIFAYAYRPVWVVWKAFGGWRSWRAARRRIDRDVA